MARTSSSMVALRTPAYDFSLPDTISDRILSMEELRGNVATVIMFICNHCPFVKHVNTQLVKLANDYRDEGISFIAISSNDVETHPEDRPELMKQVAIQQKYPFPYLYDETQDVAHAYLAACTPDFFIYNDDLLLVYHGQLDDSRPGNEIPVTGKDIRNALDCLLLNKQVPLDQKPSIGCNIKWKAKATPTESPDF